MGLASALRSQLLVCDMPDVQVQIVPTIVGQHSFQYVKNSMLSSLVPETKSDSNTRWIDMVGDDMSSPMVLGHHGGE